MSSTNRRIGVIGVGFGALIYVPGLRSEGWEISAICSRSREKVAKIADTAGITSVYTDPLEMIRRDDLDAIAITSPPSTHRDLAIAALEAGKHVLCEKPFALNAQQAAEMRDAAQRSGLTAMVDHEFRYSPQRAYIKELLVNNYIGNFRLCTAELFLDRYVSEQPRPLTWLSSRSEGGGTLGALGSHYIDAFRHWFGDIATVSAQLASFRPEVVNTATGEIVKAETEDTFLFTLTFRGGGIATMSASFAVTPMRGGRIVIMGENGTLIAEQPEANPLDNGTVIASRGGSPLRELEMPAKYTPLTDPRDPRLAAFRLLVRDFTAGIDAGISPAPNFADGLRCQEALDAIRESSETGRTVELA